MGVALNVVPLRTAQVVHAVAAPFISGRGGDCLFQILLDPSPVWTAVAWLSLVILLDFFVVALLIERAWPSLAVPRRVDSVRADLPCDGHDWVDRVCQTQY
jgi:hypothetical protein